MLFLNLHEHGILLPIFFGVFGYLVFTSEFLRGILGVLLIMPLTPKTVLSDTLHRSCHKSVLKPL